MISEVTDALFPDGEPLAYRSFINGKEYALQWTRFLGEAATGIFGFEFFLDLDPVVIGQGGARVQVRSRLQTDDQLRPIRYITIAHGARMKLAVASQTITATLPNGQERQVPRNDAGYILEANMPGMDAILLAHQAALGQLKEEARLRFFLLNNLMTMPVTLTRADDLEAPEGARWYRSSLLEELLIQGDGRLLRSRNPQQGLDSVAELPAPPLPSWTDDAAASTIELARYAPPDGRSFTLEDVEFDGPTVRIGGAVTIPAGAGPFPAVLLISGSGVHDRHGITGELDLGNHETMDHLAEAGFVGLRYDKQGAGTTPQDADYLERGTQALIDDARAAWAYLLSRPEVDPSRVFVVGHSEGGLVALALATRYGAAVAGIALMASVGRSWEEIGRDQTASQGRLVGMSEEQVQAQLARMEEFFELVRSDREWAADEIPDIHFAAGRTITWLRESLQYAPAEMIREATAPVLVCHGDKDFQVSPDRDSQRLVDAARSAGVTVTFNRYPGLDHLMKPIEGESTLATYYDRSRRVDPGFLADLAAWFGDPG